MPRSTQSEISKNTLPVKKLVELVTIDPANLKNNKRQSEQSRPGKRVLLVLTAITFCIGVAATWAWQSYGDGASKAIGRPAPQAAQAAQNTPDIFAPTASATPSPDQRQLDGMSLDLDEVRQRVDQLATSIAAIQEQMTQSVDRIAASHERIAQTVDHLAASQEQMKHEITTLQAIEQYILYKNSEPSALKPVPRPVQTRAAR